MHRISEVLQPSHATWFHQVYINVVVKDEIQVKIILT